MEMDTRNIDWLLLIIEQKYESVLTREYLCDDGDVKVKIMFILVNIHDIFQ